MVDVPLELRFLSSFFKIHMEFKSKDEVVSYGCLLYFISKAVKVRIEEQETKLFLSHVLSELEKWKNELFDSPFKELVESDDALGKHILIIANHVYEWAESEDGKNNSSNSVVKNFYFANQLFLVSRNFTNLSEKEMARKKFAIQRSLYLKKCAERNTLPVHVNQTESTQDQSETAAENPTYNKMLEESRQEPVTAFDLVREPVTAFDSVQQPVTAFHSVQQPVTAFDTVQQPVPAFDAVQQPTSPQRPVSLHSVPQHVLQAKRDKIQLADTAKSHLKYATSSMQFHDYKAALDFVIKAKEALEDFLSRQDVSF